jgi:Fusaric acid resistance protein family
VAIGGVVLVGVGTDHRVLWVLLPITILIAGIAPTAISFAAGQAAFTVVIVVLFTIIAPKGLALGLVRIEDVALGCGVSVVVGALFWPRGAAVALGTALDDAYGAASDRVRGIVHTLTGRPMPTEKERALAARQRLDDAFRQFLAEPGVARRVPLENAAALAGAATRLRLVADSLEDLCTAVPVGPLPPDLTEAGAELRAVSDGVDLWYRTLGDVLAGRRTNVPSPDPPDSQLPRQLVGHLRTGVGAGDAAAGRQALLLLWGAQHLDSLRRAEPDLVEAAGAVVALRRRALLR